MREPSLADSFEVLCLQAADQGRGPVLFGDSLARARTLAKPFIVGELFPDVYLEFPLKGDPFLDVTVLYGQVKPGTRIDSEAAAGADVVFDWFSDVRKEHERVSFGFELDTHKEDLPPAAIHFQPRNLTELVEPFCRAIGEPERAKLYVNTCKRMPPEWQLSFFGLFRGRPDSPLRICGYLSKEEGERCAQDKSALVEVFDQVGFSDYDNEMLEQICRLMVSAPKGLDFQFDVYPDGTLGDTFAIDAQFQIERPQAVLESFSSGVASRVINLFEEWGITDDRWQRAVEATFARSIPVERDNGSIGKFAFTLMPQWTKARWRNTVLQPAKLYCLANACMLDKDDE
ncbi:MAG: hypothetical protein IJ092_06125 [Atopobiaceae bacterium]|nr:hypothetical protein [Atopobiaceae bacterium]